jgi:DNA excision repair protein ERCC-5
VKGFRDVSGHALPHAHVLGLFHRICKLLFYRIKPVFVFDGVPPALKRNTLARRRRQKAAAVKGATKNTAKILDNLLRSHTVARKLQRQSEMLDKAASQGIKAVLADRTRTASKEKDLFELPALQDDQDADSDSDREGVSDEILQRLNIDHRTDIHQVDLEGDAFKALPTEQQYEVLMELRERRKQNSWAKLHEMPREATDFSGFQMQRLIKRSTMQKRMDSVGSDLSEQNLLKLDENLFVGDRAGLKRQKAERKRIAGSDFVYIDYSQPSEPWEPSTSKKADGAEETDYTDQDEAIANALARSQEDEHVSQNQMLALAAMQEGLSDDEDSLIVMPSTSFMRSSYHGGLYPGEEPFALEVEESSSVLKNVPVMSEESSSSSDASIKEELEEEKADDLFADVFESKDNVEALDSIFAGSTSEKEPMEEKEAIEITIDVARKQARHKRHASQTSHDSSNSANKDPISTVENAYQQFDDTVDMLSHISKRAKRDSVHSEDSTKKDIAAELAATMKKSDHLMLKVFSKYAEESQGDQEKRLERQNSKKQKSDLEVMLESQTETLVKEMNMSNNEERLRAIKQIRYDDAEEAAKILETERKECIAAGESEAERRVFESHGVELQGDEASASIKATPDTESLVTYGSSAPGFVRSGKRDVIEVLPSAPAPESALDEAILEKLDERDVSAADSLTDEELRKIQVSP